MGQVLASIYCQLIVTSNSQGVELRAPDLSPVETLVIILGPG